MASQPSLFLQTFLEKNQGGKCLLNLIPSPITHFSYLGPTPVFFIGPSLNHTVFSPQQWGEGGEGGP